ncbi:NAD(P)H-binding protein [Auraticoccus monumenti]|uniref:Uncharacterized conserved protein YbjT, contains NAD(P)-binding and DUF2867 domains n=1 Tax=Auraticoccus monumenti TaxID=675864 RepID=A0A1G6XCJ3_9ACTN|nr:NAD(P)H-binding protein [Auraticoccus monumenti]SDD75015.1 Uncharacterized conserved protein YbjT, contains NAD(P)-binding and DUF2867 domains [Auraticoccus monumenti]
MHVAVTTPTGNVGSVAARLLVQAGLRPRLLLRDPGRLPEDLAARCDVVVLDLQDPDAVVRATAGLDALLWIQPDTGAEDPVEQHRVLARTAARAVGENGIAHLVLQSSVGAEARHGFGEIDGLGAAEDELSRATSGLTVLRCGYFFTNLLMDLPAIADGVLATTMPLDLPLAWVDPADVATVAVLRLLAPAPTQPVVQAVLGPHDLSHTQAAEVLTAALGRPVRAERVDEEDVAGQLRALGFAEPRVQAVVGMARGMASGFVPETPRDVTSTTSSTLRGWASAVLLPVLDPARG